MNEEKTPLAPRYPIFTAKDFGVAGRYRPVLSALSLQMHRGEILAVLGRHGAGGEYLRDMFLGTIADRRTTGSFVIGDPKRDFHPRLSYLAGPAENPLSPYAPTGRQLVRILARRAQIPFASAEEELRLVLERLPKSPDFSRLKTPPSMLSPHECALAFLALALGQNPDVVMADDPTSGLDPVEAGEFLARILAERDRTHFALLYFTANPATAARLGGRIAVLHDGKLIEEGSAGRLSSEHAHAYTQALFRTVLRATKTNKKPRTGPHSEPLLQVRNFYFEQAPRGRFDPAKGLSFELKRGAGLALVGEHGSGWRLLVRAVLGLEHAGHGQIVFDAVDIGILSNTMRVRLRRRVAFISGGDDVLDPRMTVSEVVTEPMRTNVNLGSEENRRAAETMLKRVGMGDIPLRRLAADLNPLNQRRLQVARALAATPQLLVLYDPLSGLDAPGQALMLDLLKDMWAREGTSFLLITADFAVAQALCENALVMAGRELVESGPVDELIRRPRHAHTKALVDAVFAARL